MKVYKIIFSLIFLLTAFMLSTVSASADYSEDCFLYVVENGSVKITLCFGNEEEITVPESIAGYPVNSVASGAFRTCGAKVVHLPDCVAAVEEGAFPSEMRVEYYAVGGSAQHVHSYAFSELTKAPTCTEKGTRKWSCSCGESFTEDVPAAGHMYKSKVVQPTSSSRGYTVHTCSACGNSYTDSYTSSLASGGVVSASAGGTGSNVSAAAFPADKKSASTDKEPSSGSNAGPDVETLYAEASEHETFTGSLKPAATVSVEPEKTADGTQQLSEESSRAPVLKILACVLAAALLFAAALPLVRKVKKKG